MCLVVDINAYGCVALCVWLLTLMQVAVLPYVFVVDINASGCVAFCVWLLTLMPVAVLPYVFGC